MNVVARALGRARAAVRPGTAPATVGPIGVDLALEELHLVQMMRAAGARPQVRARASLALPMSRSELLGDPAAFRGVIRRALAADAFEGRDAVLTVPSGLFRTISINYRSGGGEQQESAAIARVMAERLDGNLADYIIDYMPVRSRTRTDDRLALVAVSERAPVLDFLELVRRTGLDVRALEIGPVAVTRLIGAIAAEDPARNVLVVNSGRKASYLTLISGSDLLFDQEVRIGERSLVGQVAESLDIPLATARDLIVRTGVHPSNLDGPVGDVMNLSGAYHTLAEILRPEFLKLVDEIKRAFLYAAAETRGGAIAQVYLLGSIARWPGSDRLLSKLSGIAVEKIPDPLALFPGSAPDVERGTGDSATEIAVAMGLALRGLRADA